MIKNSILEMLAKLPQIDSLRIANDIIKELEGRGYRIVHKDNMVKEYVDYLMSVQQAIKLAK